MPDDNWIWANDWEIEINSDLGATNDADGWEYESDFETFKVTPRFYQRGDSCRRRRWTRTRLIRPPRLDDPMKVLRIVWDTRKGENGNVVIKARGHFTLHNKTCISLTFFGFCHSWEKYEFIGNALPGTSLSVPIHLASATHIRLATPKKLDEGHNESPSQINEYFVTNPLMILPTGFVSKRIIRTSILCEQDISRDSNGLSTLKKLNFLLKVNCTEGVFDVYVEPVLRVINLLPCQIQCQLGENVGCSGIKGSKLVQREEISVFVGKEANSLSIDCRAKPHLSVRLPG